MLRWNVCCDAFLTATRQHSRCSRGLTIVLNLLRHTCGAAALMLQMVAWTEQAGGSAKLEAMLAHDAEEATPEFLRQRPKYYYYHLWMRDRIAEHCGRDLPEPVVLKMLDMEAGELDLVLNYPRAAQQQVSADALILMPVSGHVASANRVASLLYLLRCLYAAASEITEGVRDAHR